MASTSTGLVLGASLLAVLCASVWAQLDSTLDPDWDLWKTTHDKKYSNEVEELGRRVLWEKNLRSINTHNLEASLGRHTYTLAMNHLGDLSDEEFSQYYGTLRVPADQEGAPSAYFPEDLAVPDSVDWRTKGYVTKVKNQGQCGSCWAFCAVGALEGLVAKTTGRLVDLSPQNLVDCSGRYGNNGCMGGNPALAFQYIVDNGGIESESSYPYRGRVGSCRYRAARRAATCSGYQYVQGEEALKRAVGAQGPVAVAIHASCPSFKFYMSGVLNDQTCNQQVDHGVVAVGYGTDAGQEFWLIKNSWGTGWGEQGYVRIARNKGGVCRIGAWGVYPQ